LRRSSEQYWFKTTTERASSIQEVIARDSIVARRRRIADFFNSIGQKPPYDHLGSNVRFARKQTSVDRPQGAIP
jgi:hypothetical protein